MWYLICYLIGGFFYFAFVIKACYDKKEVVEKKYSSTDIFVGAFLCGVIWPILVTKDMIMLIKTVAKKDKSK